VPKLLGVNMKIAYQRILLKLSGEAFLGEQKFGVDFQAIHKFSEEIKELVDLGAEIAIVIGGGNFLRGASWAKQGFNQVTCDQMGMLATVMNGILLRDVLSEIDVSAHVMSAISMTGITEDFDYHLANNYLKNNKVVIFVGGTGSPFFTTDSAAALRAVEINADILLKATKVDGVYSADPETDPNAKLFKSLTYEKVLESQLEVMDLAAICLCREHNKKIRVFNMHKPGALKDIVLGKDEGTEVTK
jgi:uridylate kinase